MYISLFRWPSICLCFCLVHPLPFSSPCCYRGECDNPLWDSHRARVDQSQQHQHLHTEIERWNRNPHHWIRWEHSDTQSVISHCWNKILVHSLHGVWGSEKRRIWVLSSYRYVPSWFTECYSWTAVHMHLLMSWRIWSGCHLLGWFQILQLMNQCAQAFRRIR